MNVWHALRVTTAGPGQVKQRAKRAIKVFGQNTIDMSQMWPRAQACPVHQAKSALYVILVVKEGLLLTLYQLLRKLMTSSQPRSKRCFPGAYIIRKLCVFTPALGLAEYIVLRFNKNKIK